MENKLKESLVVIAGLRYYLKTAIKLIDNPELFDPDSAQEAISKADNYVEGFIIGTEGH